MADMVQNEVKSLMQSALEMALLVIRSNPTALEGLGSQLEGKCNVGYFLLEAHDMDEKETVYHSYSNIVSNCKFILSHFMQFKILRSF